MWSVVLAFIPKRYLIGAAALVALLVGGYAAVRLYGSHRESRGYSAGAAHVADSVSAIAIKRIAATETVYVKSAVRTDSQVAVAARGHPAQHLVIQPVPVTVPDTELKVRVIVEAFHDTVDDVPVRAAQYWKQADSTAGLALQSASQWHAAYRSADSLSALWRVRALAVVPAPQGHSRVREILTDVLLIGGTAVIARHVHIKL